MKKEEFRNLNMNQKLAEKLEIILNTEDLESKYKMIQALIEYINIRALTKLFNKEMTEFDIVLIIIEYRKIDESLYQKMLSVNAKYNEIDEAHEIEEYDIEYLLSMADDIYGYIKNKYEEMV